MSRAMTIEFDNPGEARRFKMDHTVRGIDLIIPDSDPAMVVVSCDSPVNFELFHYGLKERLLRVDFKRQVYRIV